VRRWISLLILLMATSAMAPAALSQSMSNPKAGLYNRLGGYDAIAAVTDDLLGRLVADPQLGKFFVGLNDTSKTRIRQHFVDFLCKATGGPCAYMGQDMKTAHAGMNISEADWAAAVRDLQATLDKFKVPARERGEVLSAVSSLKPDIVHGM